MDHSRSAILFGTDGKPIALLPIDKGPQGGDAAVAAELEKWVQ
jgi:protein SCO1/2